MPGTIMTFEIDSVRMYYDGECSVTYNTSGNYEGDIVKHTIILPSCIYRENLDRGSYYDNMTSILRMYLTVMKQEGWEIGNSFYNAIDKGGSCV
ncbi:MAG: hypothetical protein KAS32_16290 [Candidatus Peribacteraceae bacterium]|nr:hypothetical protein [Candidatus Peribacteraceae bacterium]